MSQARPAAGMDRLPWLADDQAPPRRRAGFELAGWAVAALLAVAAAFLWLNEHGAAERGSVQVVPRTVTVPLPRARESEPRQPQVVLPPAPQVVLQPQPELPISSSNSDRNAGQVPQSEQPAARAKQQTAEAPPQSAVQSERAQASVSDATPLTPWPAWRSAGASGRIVRIGAYGSRQQAKVGWRSMVRAYPALTHLKAVTVDTRNSRGRRFFRIQIGTTSQAHSEVLCQRVQRIHLSCAVVGLPSKPAGVER